MVCYATVGISLLPFEDTPQPDIDAGDKLRVSCVYADGVSVTDDNGSYWVIPMEVFTHCFTVNPDDIKKVKDGEYKTMGYDPKKSDKK